MARKRVTRGGVLRSFAGVAAGALAFVAIALAVAAPGAGAAGNTSLEYSGKLLIESPTGFFTEGEGSSRNFGHFRVNLSWVATANTESGAPWHFHTLKGTVHWDESGAPYPSGNPECEATLSEKSGGEDYVDVTPTGADGSKLEISTSLPLLTGLIKSSREGEGACSAESVLNGAAYAGFNVFYDYETSKAALEEMELAQGPKLIVPAGHPRTAGFDAKWNRELPTGAGIPYVIEITSTLNVDSRGTGGSGGTGHNHHHSGSSSSSGGRSCTVPQLKGKKLKGAKKSLEKADCKLGKVTRSDGVTTKTGKVVKQRPKAGTVRKAGFKVAVKLG
ncbi:MAG: PASTA domain-containing protein [Solirubrobacterales bacterium]